MKSLFFDEGSVESLDGVSADGAMIVHPALAELESEIERLRMSLAEAIRKLTYMQEVEGPHLRLLYVQQLGEIQVEVMELQAEIAILRRQIDAITARLNRGETVTRKWLDGLQEKVSREIAELLEEVLRRKNECREAEQALEGFVSVDQASDQRLKEMYRELCRALHPDMGQVDSAVFAVWWDDVQLAYSRGDLAQLESIALALGLGGSKAGPSPELAGAVVGGSSGSVRLDFGASVDGIDTPRVAVVRGSVEVLEREKERLQECLRGYVGRTEKLKAQPPFSYAELIMNPAVMEEMREDFGAQKQELMKRKAYLGEQLADLLQAFRIGETPISDAGTAT